MDRKIEKKKFTPRRLAAVTLLTVLVCFSLYALITRDYSSRLNVEQEKLTISEVTRGPFREYIPVSGAIIPVKTIYLDAIEGGRVSKRFVEAGTLVEKDDPILELENTNLLLDIMFREAELYQAANNLRNTRLAMEQNRLQLQGELLDMDYRLKTLQRQYKRNKELAEKNLIAREEYEKSYDEYNYYNKRKSLAIESYKQDSLFRKVQIGQLEASLQRMQKNLNIAKQKLDNLVLRAPISGQLTALNAEIGESKAPGERLGQVDVLDGFKVRAAIDEYYLPRINLRQMGEFDFAGQTYRLQVDKIYPEIKDGRFDVDLQFGGRQPQGIRRGQTVHIRLELGDQTESVLLPRGGFYQKTGGQWVYVLAEDGRTAVKRKIRPGRMNPRVFEILEGLQPGERVITSSYDNFGDNDKLVLK